MPGKEIMNTEAEEIRQMAERRGHVLTDADMKILTPTKDADVQGTAGAHNSGRRGSSPLSATNNEEA